MSESNSFPESPQPPANPPPYSTGRKLNAGLYFNIGVLCAIISLIIAPEIFGSASIILGAYAWRIERDENRNSGLLLIVVGIVAMLVGIYYTSFFGLYSILPLP